MLSHRRKQITVTVTGNNKRIIVPDPTEGDDNDRQHKPVEKLVDQISR